MPYTDQGLPHAGSAEMLFTGLFDEPPGTVARTIPWWGMSNGVAALTTGGQVAIRFLPLPQGLVVSNIMVFVAGTAASGPTHFWLGLVDVGLNVLAVSADQGAAAQAASTPIKLPMGTPYVVPQTGLYGVAASSSASTTAPNLGGNSLVTGLATGLLVKAGTAGNQATPPAAGSQLASGVLTLNGTSNFGAWIS